MVLVLVLHMHKDEASTKERAVSSIDLAKHSSHLSNCPAHQQRPVLNQQGRRRLPLDGGMWSSHALLLPLPPRLPLLILKAKRRAQIVVKRSFNEPHDFNALLSFQPGQNILAMLLTWPARGPWPVKASRNEMQILRPYQVENAARLFPLLLPFLDS